MTTTHEIAAIAEEFKVSPHTALRQVAVDSIRKALDQLPVTNVDEAMVALEGAIMAVMYRSFDTRTHHELRKFYNAEFAVERREGFIK
jgi:hypothetical protein